MLRTVSARRKTCGIVAPDHAFRGGGSWPDGQPVRGHTWETCPLRGRQPCAERGGCYGKGAGGAIAARTARSVFRTDLEGHPSSVIRGDAVDQFVERIEAGLVRRLVDHHRHLRR